MDDPLPVRVDQGLEDLREGVHDLLGVVGLGRLVERHPTDVLGDQVNLVVAGDDLQGLDDVLVLETLGDLAFLKARERSPAL